MRTARSRSWHGCATTWSDSSWTRPTRRRCALRPWSLPGAPAPLRRCSRSATSPTISPCGVTTPIKRAWAAITGRAVERGQHPGPGSDRGSHAAEGQLAPGTADHIHRAEPVRRLRHRPRVLGRQLLRVALPVAVLLALHHHQVRPRGQRLRSADLLVAAVPRAADPDLPAGLPAHLLLLPQGLLPVVLAVPPGLRGRRAAQAVL